MIFALKVIKIHRPFKRNSDTDVTQYELDLPNRISNFMNQDAPPPSVGTK